MAVDTAAKRASALGVAKPYLTLVIPDGTIDQANRQTIADSYSGILADAPPVIDACELFLVGQLTPELGLVGQLDTDALFMIGNITPELGVIGQIGNTDLYLVGDITPELGLTGKLCS